METVTVRSQWFEVFEDLQKEFERKLAAMEKEQLEKRALKAECRFASALDKITEQRHRIYGLETNLKEEKGKNLKLRAQINRDYENSSIPSSKSRKPKKISNSRKKTAHQHPGDT